MENLNHIHIFKTNIQKENLGLIGKVFRRHQSIRQWNVDTEDCDLVLRVVSEAMSEDEIAALVTQTGFECCDLA